MIRKLSILFILPLIFLFSCSSSNEKNLYEDADYISCIDYCDIKLKTEITETTLYYKTMSLYSLSRYKESFESAELYTLLFKDDNDKNIIMNRIILYYGDSNKALKAGRILQEINPTFDKEDAIQYYKILNDNKLYSEASLYLSNITSNLTIADYTFCLIYAKANVWQIVSALEQIYSSEGVSNNFLTAMDLYLNDAVLNDEIRSSVEIFINKTFNNEKDYSKILAAYYTAISDNSKANYYHKIAYEN